MNTIPSTIGVNELNDTDFELAPNPTADRIKLSGFEEPIIGYTVIDISGKVVRNSIGMFGHTLKIELSDLPQETYLVKVQSEKGVGVKRFVKL